MKRPAVIAVVVLASLSVSAQEAPTSSWSRPTFNDAVFGFGGGNYDRELGEFTLGGIGWNGHITFNANKYLGVEVTYQGLRSGVKDVLLSNGVSTGGSTIFQNTFTLDGKWTLPFATSARTTLEPYLFAGIGYSHLSTEKLFSVDSAKIDNAAAIPIGGGVSFVFPNHVIIDARFTYNFLLGERSPSIQTGNSWQAVLGVGYRVLSLL